MTAIVIDGKALAAGLRAKVAAEVRRLAGVHGLVPVLAVVMVGHDVNPILPYLDRVIYIARGSAAIGAPEEVITADQLGALYGIPIEVLRDRAGRLFVVGQSDVPAMHVDGARG